MYTKYFVFLLLFACSDSGNESKLISDRGPGIQKENLSKDKIPLEPKPQITQKEKDQNEIMELYLMREFHRGLKPIIQVRWLDGIIKTDIDQALSDFQIQYQKIHQRLLSKERHLRSDLISGKYPATVPDAYDELARELSDSRICSNYFERLDTLLAEQRYLLDSVLRPLDRNNEKDFYHEAKWHSYQYLIPLYISFLLERPEDTIRCQLSDTEKQDLIASFFALTRLYKEFHILRFGQMSIRQKADFLYDLTQHNLDDYTGWWFWTKTAIYIGSSAFPLTGWIRYPKWAASIYQKFTVFNAQTTTGKLGVLTAEETLLYLFYSETTQTVSPENVKDRIEYLKRRYAETAKAVDSFTQFGLSGYLANKVGILPIRYDLPEVYFEFLSKIWYDENFLASNYLTDRQAKYRMILNEHGSLHSAILYKQKAFLEKYEDNFTLYHESWLRPEFLDEAAQFFEENP